MGKYSHVINALEKDWNTEPEFQEKVNVAKAVILTAPTEADDLILGKRPSADDIKSMLAKLREIGTDLNETLQWLADGKRQAGTLARGYREVRRVKDAIDEVESVINVTLMAYSQLIGDQYEVEGVSTVKLETGESVAIQYEPAAKVVDKEGHRQWCLENGYEQQMVLPWQTTNAITKERVEKRLPTPTGVEAKARPKMVLRKG